MSGFSGQGKVYLGFRRTGGGAGAMKWLGNASVFRLGLGEDRRERKESFSGARGNYRAMTTGRSGDVTITFDEFSNDNMAWAVLGDMQKVVAGTNTGFVAPTGLKVGDNILLPHRDVTVTGIVDSAGSPVTIPTSKYTVDGKAGLVAIVASLAAYTQPAKVTYTYTDQNVVGAFNLGTTEAFVRFDGLNTDNGERCIVDVFRCRLSPTKQIDFINNDDFADFELTGSMLADSDRPLAGVGGQYFQIVRDALLA